MPSSRYYIKRFLIKLIWYNTNSERTCRITGFYEMWCPTAQTKSLWDKWEIYNQKWYNFCHAGVLRVHTDTAIL